MPYTPQHPGEGITVEWLFSELQRISSEMGRPNELQFSVLTIEPTRPQDGLVVYADGTAWNPGSGRGLYERRSGAWVKL